MIDERNIAALHVDALAAARTMLAKFKRLGISGRVSVASRPAWGYVRVTVNVTGTYGDSLAQDTVRARVDVAGALAAAGLMVSRVGDEMRVTGYVAQKAA